MKRKTRITLSAILLILLTLTLMTAFVDAKKGGKKRLPCAGPLLYTSQSPTGTLCYSRCGAPAECNEMIVGGKGPGCDFGQICDNTCYCIWVDKDIDGYDTTTCVEGEKNWMSLPQVDVITGDYEWDLSEGVKANSFQLVQVKGGSITEVYKLEFYGENFQKTYDYSSESDGYFALSSVKKLVIMFEETVTITRIVVTWDDNNLGNVVEPIFYTQPGSSTCDCNDYDAYIHPQAVELCDNKDNDCDGIVDEDDVCEKNIYICKTDSFVMEKKGDGKILSYGHCAGGEWCSNKIIGQQGSCTYTTTEEGGLGQKDFYAYVCDMYTCYKFTKGIFMVCGEGWNCTEVCVPGECNYDTKQWCNDLGIWQEDGWCQSECGKSDSTCGGVICEDDTCDPAADKWCKNGYWVEEDYCNCDICGSIDSDCTECTCENGACDTASDEYCENGVWEIEGYCWTACCQKDYDCYVQGICETCTPGTCDTKNNRYCLDGVWTYEDYCEYEYCGPYDSDCGIEPCEDGECDTTEKKYCQDGEWIDPGENYCTPGYCGTKDSSCECSNEKDDCCKGEDDGICDTDCTEEGDPDCVGVCTPDPNDCCYPDDDGICDADCIDGVDPDCQSCGIGADDCCSDLSDGNCDPDCTEDGDPDCVGECTPDPGDCCSDLPDGICDPDCNDGVDSDCQSCGIGADDCCSDLSDGNCDPDCTEDGDPDCVGECTPEEGDCCYPDADDTCDLDCIHGMDSDCPSCGIGADDCCSDLSDGNCDPDCTEDGDPDCVGKCTPSSGDCCDPINDDICDSDCITGLDPDCPAQPCEENWVCNEWDVDCDGVNDEHTCLEWEDTNNCNTFFDKPDDTQPCYIEFPCTEDDDTDHDGYPERACYDAENDIILEELDCDDNDDSQNPAAEEICNGEDDNCDDSIDESCPCEEEGATQICGKNEGVCKQGLQLCTEGLWSICGGSGYVGPSKEACDDGLDNNCDSYIDENCRCEEGQQQDCGSDAGICEEGWQACYNGSFGSVCNDEMKGVTEICNNELDDDCDDTIDGDDSNCQVTTPLTTGAEHCKNRIQDAGEKGIDCGDGKDCADCSEKSPACDYGKIEEKCTCGLAEYKTGYCCNGKYYLIQCTEPAKDSDNDGCNDDKEFKLGTDLNNADTDGDGKLDCDPSEQYPLCNEDGTCDAEKEYPETLENCPTDCGKKGLGWLTWVLLILILLALISIGLYLYAKSKGYKLSDIINIIRGKKKVEGQRFTLDFFRRALPASISRPEKKRNVIKLKEFVNSALKKGYTKLQIKQSALKAGWTEEEIEEALKGKKSEYKILK